MINNSFLDGDISFNDQVHLTGIRHKEAVMAAIESIDAVLQAIDDEMPEDFFTIDMMDAYKGLGLINGETASEDLVNKIFKNFVWENKMEVKKMPYTYESYDAVVIGAGHAGCEAALATARLGLKTLIFTVSVDSIAMMPCNPNVGGSSKGHLVREIDALGGEMGKNIDRTFIQTKMLNMSKGPAVHSLRAQG